MRLDAALTAGVSDDLAGHAWAGADRDLAQAWRDAAALAAKLDRLATRRAARTPPDRDVEALALQALAVLQTLVQAARRRGLRLFHETSRATPFDPARMESLDAAIAEGASARVLAPGVETLDGRVIVKAQVRASAKVGARAPKKRADPNRDDTSPS